ncbi:MAG: hypothetical protein LM580_00385 [Thermofilum sp.]|nr:hypothetical protein [Thermofilum sp.]
MAETAALFALTRENIIDAAAGALGGLLAAAVLTAAKWAVEWGRPSVKLATGLVDAALGGYLLYRQLTKRGAWDPFLDTAASTFALLELLVGISALVSSLG